jgi:phage shock protein C
MKEEAVLRLKYEFEKQGFEVCSRLGERMSLPARHIRLFFIYASFLALGSPIILYMALAFILNLKDYVYQRKTSFWDI